MPPYPLNGLELTVEFNLCLEKSVKVRESQGISYCLESGNPGFSKLSTTNLLAVMIIAISFLGGIGNRYLNSQ